MVGHCWRTLALLCSVEKGRVKLPSHCFSIRWCTLVVLCRSSWEEEWSCSSRCKENNIWTHIAVMKISRLSFSSGGSSLEEVEGAVWCKRLLQILMLLMQQSSWLGD